MRRALGWSLDGALAAIGATLTATLLATLLLQALLGQRLRAIDLWFCDRVTPWWLSRHDAIGVRWINGFQQIPQLLGAVPLPNPMLGDESSEGDAPEPWARAFLPDLGSLPADSRFAALGAGWPFPAFVRTWVVLDPHAAFPIHAELDLSGFAIESAVARLGETGLEGIRVRPLALAADALPWFALQLWGLRRLRARRLNRSAASATPRAPAA